MDLKLIEKRILVVKEQQRCDPRPEYENELTILANTKRNYQRGI